MKKLSKVLTLAVAFMMMFPMVVSAEETAAVYAGKYAVADGQIQVHISNNLADENTASEYSLTLGGDALDMLSVETGESSVSYLYLIDVSGSIKAASSGKIEDTFNNLIAYLDEEDNAALMFVGNDTSVTKFTSDKDELVKEYNDYQRAAEDTNLYYAIDQALKVLDTNADCHERTCLVVLSDGEDDKLDGITADEVKETIKKVHIPVCVINIFGDKPSEESMEKAKITGSFARMSPGGVNITYGENDMDSVAAAGIVASVAENYYVAIASLASYKQGNTNTELKVTMTLSDGTTVSDTIQVDGADLPMAESEPEEKPEAVSEAEQPEEENTEDTETEENTMLPIIFAAVVVILVIVVICLQKRNKKTKKQLGEKEIEIEKQKQAAENAAKEPEKVIIREVQVMVPEKEIKKQYAMDITMTKVGDPEDEALKLHIDNELTIGRLRNKADVSFSQDTRLSALHCRFICDEQGLFLEDMGSTNGTYLNGVPLKERRHISDGDLILLGSYEWRIGIEEEKPEGRV